MSKAEGGCLRSTCRAGSGNFIRAEGLDNGWCKKQENTKAELLALNLKAFLLSFDQKFKRKEPAEQEYLLEKGTGVMGN